MTLRKSSGLTQATNLYISDDDPAVYLPEIAERNPGVLESHWIPMDRDLWDVTKYRDFLSAHRELLARAANDFLDSLLAGSRPEEQEISVITDRAVVHTAENVPAQADSDDELIRACSAFVAAQGLPPGIVQYELSDATTGDPLAILDLAWPEGLQQGYSAPTAILIEPDRATEESVNRVGLRFFTSLPDFQHYVEREILSAAL